MKEARNPNITFNDQQVQLEAEKIQWDSGLLGFQVFNITKIEVLSNRIGEGTVQAIKSLFFESQVGLVSCRIPAGAVHESFFLCQAGFKFIEMNLHPHLTDLERFSDIDIRLNVRPASKQDIPILTEIALTAFRHERFHVDPRIPDELANQRYANWVQSSISSDTQRLLAITDGGELVGFFIVENSNNTSDWLLTAVGPKWQGRGIGERVWRAVLRYQLREGITEVKTTISARNYQVLSLYSKLQFRFAPADATYHWAP